MKEEKDKKNKNKKEGLADEIWSTSWTYIRTVVDTAREPFLILDEDLRVMASNSCFFRMFEVSEKETEGELVYNLGNGQWNIPKLKELLEEILPKDTFLKDFEVDHEFPDLGRKIMLLNARRIFFESEEHSFPPLILLAMEDVTERRMVSEKLAEYAQNIETQVDSKIEALDNRVNELAKLHEEIVRKDLVIKNLTTEIKELKDKKQNS